SYVGVLEKKKFAATHKPRATRAGGARSRWIPAPVRRAVWERDGGQCTFVSESGHRCSARRFLEFDHVHPFARGGKASIEGIRLRCRAHNQYEAERTFGTEFMQTKREKTRNGHARNYGRVARSEPGIVAEGNQPYRGSPIALTSTPEPQ